MTTPPARILHVGTRHEPQHHIVTVRCPYCDGRHAHVWDGSGSDIGPCDAVCGGGVYYVGHPWPSVAIPGICGAPLKAGGRCRRRVRHHGWPCRHHRSEPLCGCQNDFLLL
jgi:hypothetical protein